MYHLGEILWYCQRSNHVCDFDLDQLEQNVLVDLDHVKLKFRPIDIRHIIRQVANEVNILTSSLNIKKSLNKVSNICIILPRYSSSLLFTFLGITALSHVALILPDGQPKLEYIKIFKQTEIDLIITDQKSGKALVAADECNIPKCFFKWVFLDDVRSLLDKESDAKKSTFAKNGIACVIGNPDKQLPNEMSKDLILTPREYDPCLLIITPTSNKYMLTHRNLAASIRNNQSIFQFVGQIKNSTGFDVTYNVLPLFGLNGLLVSCITSISRCALTILSANGFDSKVYWQLILEYNVTWASLTPNMVQTLVDDSDITMQIQSNLRFVKVSSAKLSAELIYEFEKLFNVPILQSYSSSYCSHLISSDGFPKLSERTIGSVGHGVGLEIAIIDNQNNVMAKDEIGRIVVRGYSVLEPELLITAKDKENCFISHSDINWTNFQFPDMAYVFVTRVDEEDITKVSKAQTISRNIDLDDKLDKHKTYTSRLKSFDPIRNILESGDIIDSDSSSIKDINIFTEGSAAKRNNSLLSSSMSLPLYSDGLIHLESRYRNFTLTSKVSSIIDEYSELSKEADSNSMKECIVREDPKLSPLPPNLSWFITTDTGYISKEGDLFIVSADEIIATIEDQKVCTTEIEFSILQCENVKECCVIAVLTRPNKQELLALLVLEDEEKADETVENVKAYLKEELARHKNPTIFKVTANLIRKSDGSLDRNAIYHEEEKKHRRGVWKETLYNNISNIVKVIKNH